MQRELQPAKDLVDWPISATLIDIQLYYSTWYNWARTQCRVQSLSHRKDVNNDNEIVQQHQQQLSCYCHPPSPYKINELWSLQNALRYGCNLFLDKSFRLSHWSSSLSSSCSSLSYVDQKKMIHYATHDVMAVTFLIRPVTKNWTFEKIKNRKISEMFLAFKSTKLPSLPTSTKKKRKSKNINMQTITKILRDEESDARSITSDEEIYMDQLVKPIMNNYFHEDKSTIELPIVYDDKEDEELSVYASSVDLAGEQELNNKEKLNNEQQLNDNELFISGSYMVDDVCDADERVPTKRRRTHRQRSEQYRKKKNKRRSLVQKKRRYYHSIQRKWYPRFSMLMVKKILHLYHINYTHVKDEGDELKIGLKDQASETTAEHQLPRDIFNRRSYFYYRKKFRR